MRDGMKHLGLLVACLLGLPAWASVAVFATVPEWGALVREIGGDKVQVFVATHALQDPHRIEAKPSLLARARGAQLVVATGADLEIGWLPVVLRESGNAAILPGRPGYFEAATVVPRLEIPAVLDRAQGDVHPAGNPHIQLDPANILRVGEALTARLVEIDPAQAPGYRANWQSFAQRWQAAMTRWQKEAAVLKGLPVLVQHKSFSYLLNWLGMQEVGTLEPKPGVEPGSAYLGELLVRQQARPAKMVLRAAYQHDGPSQWMASRAGIPAVVLPFTVGGNERAVDLFSLFDDTVARLNKALVK